MSSADHAHELRVLRDELATLLKIAFRRVDAGERAKVAEAFPDAFEQLELGSKETLVATAFGMAHAVLSGEFEIEEAA